MKNKGKGLSSEVIDSAFYEYTKNSELLDTLKEFAEMRIVIGKPFVTNGAITRLLNKLDKLSNGNDNVKIALLEKSILNNWQDIWEVKSVVVDTKKKCNYKTNYNSMASDTTGMTREELNRFMLSKNDLDEF